MVVEWPFLAVPLSCLRFVIMVFADHTHLLFLKLTLALYPFVAYMNYLHCMFINIYENIKM